jgi:uncharacterized BrkB/YihY/UPF0761 family membrane protein
VALIITLSITSVAGSAQQLIISALYLDNIEWLKPGSILSRFSPRPAAGAPRRRVTERGSLRAGCPSSYEEKIWIKYFRDLISLIGLLVALIITLSITSVAGSGAAAARRSRKRADSWQKSRWRDRSAARRVSAIQILSR